MFANVNQTEFLQNYISSLFLNNTLLTSTRACKKKTVKPYSIIFLPLSITLTHSYTYSTARALPEHTKLYSSVGFLFCSNALCFVIVLFGWSHNWPEIKDARHTMISKMTCQYFRSNWRSCRVLSGFFSWIIVNVSIWENCDQHLHDNRTWICNGL